MDEILQIGEAVIYHDTTGTPFNALITASWGQKRADGNAINLVYVSGDDSEKDAYGRQTKRESSVSHVSKTNVWGRYWRFPDEKPRPIGEVTQ